MKKILIYFNSMQASGGIERVIATLCDRLVSQYELTILVKDAPVSFYELNKQVKIESLNNPIVFNMRNLLSRMYAAVSTIVSNHGKLKTYCVTNQFDYYYVAHPLQVLEIKLVGVEESKIIISEHGARSAYNIFYRLIKFFLYKRCASYIIPTIDDTKAYLEKNFPAVYIPHFRSNLPYCLSTKCNNTVLTIGRLTAEKQQNVLIDIWNRIIHFYGFKNWKLKIVGNGELEQQLRKQVKKYDLTAYVQFCPPSPDVAKHYKESSLFALTSFSEGFGMVLLEAISFGLPCISFDCPSGPRDIIKHGISGYLIEPNDTINFEKSLITLLKDAMVLRTMGYEAYKSSKEWGDGEILKKWEQILI